MRAQLYLWASMPDSLIRTSTSASLPTDEQAANCGTVKRALRYAADYYNFDRAQYENRWTGAGSTNEHPSAKALLKTWNKSDSSNASYFVESSDYFRIQNITLGYSFKNLKIGSYVMPGLRLSLTADRPFTTFKANSFTPEVSDAEGWDTEPVPL